MTTTNSNSLPPALRNGNLKNWILGIAGGVITISIVAIVTTLIAHTSSLAAQEVKNQNVKSCLAEVKDDQRAMKNDIGAIKVRIGQIDTSIDNVKNTTDTILHEIRNGH